MRVAAVLLLTVCLAATAAAEEPFVGLDALDPFLPEDRDPARLQHLDGLGRAFVRSAPIAWGSIERQPQRGGPPRYDWQALDEAVLVWQLTGLDPVLVLTPKSGWASLAREAAHWVRHIREKLPTAEAEAALRTSRGCPPPRGDAWSRWERFVRDVAERYDADGTSDMPGLRRPVRHLQVLDRIDPDAWLGSADDTLRLLHHAVLGARHASKGTRILTPAFDLRATGHAPHPDTREWDYRISKLLPEGGAGLARLEIERAFGVARRVLEMPRLFHIVCHLGSEHHADDVANVEFLHKHLLARDAGTKSVWLVDNPTRKLGAPQAGGVVAPKPGEVRVRGRWLPVATNPLHSQHDRALGWLRHGQAYDLVRSLCRSRAAGAAAVLFRSPWDALHRAHPQRTAGAGQGLLAPRAEGDAPALGLRRTPSWFALAQAQVHLAGHVSAAETSIGAPGRSVIFRFGDKAPRPWVAVLMLDARLSWAGTPGEPPPMRDVLVPLPSGTYRLEWCRTGPEEPRRKTVEVREGMLPLSLGPAPVYVIPQ